MRLFLIICTLFSISLSISAQTNFTWDVDTGCAPLLVRFAVDTSSVNVLPTDVAEWEFDNGTILNAGALDTVEFRFREAKLQRVQLTISGSISTNISKFYTGVQEPLNSRFRYTKNTNAPDYTYTFTPLIENLKPNATYTFRWQHLQISDGSILDSTSYTNVTNPTTAINEYTYADTGLYQIQLRIREVNQNYVCESSTDTILPILDEFVVGNVFAPNEISEYFIIDPEDADVVLSFKLFSQTGIKILEQEAPVIYWDGRNSSGQDLGTGVYFYLIEATQTGNTPQDYYTKQGFIHMFR